MFTSRYALLLPLFVAAAVALHAQPYRTVQVGLEPAALAYDPSTSRLHAWNVGIDRNFNGVYEPDSGDVSAAWYVVDPFTGQKLDSSLMNGFFTGFPLRVGVDLAGRHLYACVGNAVNEYDLDNMNLIRQVWQGYFSGVSYDPTNKLVLMHERPGFTDPGRLVAYNQAQNRVEFVLPTGINPQMTLNNEGRTSPRVENYTLCEGVFGQPNSAVSYSMYVEDDFATVNAVPLGADATTMARGASSLYLAVAGSSQVHIVDAASGLESPISPIFVNGAPQSLALLASAADATDSLLIVGTQTGQVYWYDAASGLLLDSVEFEGSVETMALLDTALYVGLSLDPPVYGRTIAVGHTSHLPYDTLATSLSPLALYGDRRADLQLVGYQTEGLGDMRVIRQVFKTATGAKQSDDSLRLGATLRSSIAYDPSVDSLFIAFSDSVLIYDGVGGSSTPTAIDTFFLPFSVTRPLTLAGNYLLVGEGPRVIIFDLKAWRAVGMFNAQGTLVSVSGAASEQGELRGDTRAFVALSNNQQGAHLTRLEFQPSVLPDSSTLGIGATHLLSAESGEAFLVTLNGSHEIVALDPFQGTIYGRLSTGTSGFDGPREAAALENNQVAVTTYRGDVLVYDEDGNFEDTLGIGGRGEAMLLINDTTLAVTRAFGLGVTYPADSALLLINPRNLPTSDVRRDGAVAGASVSLDECAPNPASSVTRVRVSVPRAGRVQLQVIDARGRLVATALDQTMESGAWSAQLDVSALPAGNYILVARHSAGQAQRALRVVR